MTAGLARAVGTVVTRCLRVRPGEEVVVAGDEPSRELGVGTNDRARPGGT